MRRSFRLILALLACAVMLAACGAQPAPEQSAPVTTVSQPATAATEAPPQTPTVAATAAPTEPATPADWLATASVDGDYYVLGNPAAPVRLTDYSDFL